MEKELSALLESYPTRVNWTDVVDFFNFNERHSAINCIVVNTIGVSEGIIEFIPNNEPPLKEEILCWIWVIRPDLSKALLTLDISEGFRILLNSYIDSSMEEFWNYISSPRTENYIQYGGGYQKDNINEIDIEQAIRDIQQMDDEHGAFWVSVITNDENVIEVNKSLSLSIIFDGIETKYQATNWNEVKELYNLLLLEKFDEIKGKTTIKA